jgi:hypothetical protein
MFPSPLRKEHRTPNVILAAMLLLSALGAAQVANAQCADPRGNAYCSGAGQVTFSPPPAGQSPANLPCADPRGNAYCQSNPSSQNAQGGQVIAPAQPPSTGTGVSNPSNSPAVQSNAPAAANASLSIDPPVAPAGASVTVTGQGFGAARSASVNLSNMVSTGGLNLGAKQLATINTAADGSLSTTVTIPSVPSWTAGQANICVINASAQPVCAPFTLGSAEQAAVNTATTPDSIIGHYQCSSMTLINFGGGFCTGAEPILAINPDGTYEYGDEQGNWSFDGSTVTFDGSLGSASVLNRRFTIDTQVDMPDGSGTQEVRFIYIRMDY